MAPPKTIATNIACDDSRKKYYVTFHYAPLFSDQKRQCAGNGWNSLVFQALKANECSYYRDCHGTERSCEDA